MLAICLPEACVDTKWHVLTIDADPLEVLCFSFHDIKSQQAQQQENHAAVSSRALQTHESSGLDFWKHAVQKVEGRHGRYFQSPGKVMHLKLLGHAQCGAV